MSMWLSIVRVDKETFAEIAKNPKVLDSVFFEDKDGVCATLGIEESDTCGVDYRILADGYEEMAEALGEEVGDPLEEDLGPAKELDFDAGYGAAFYLEPPQVKKAAKDSMIPEMDDDAKRVFKAAAKQGDYLIGIVS